MSKVRIFQVSHEKARLGAEDCPWSIEWRENGRRRQEKVGTREQAEEKAIFKRRELEDGAAGVIPHKPWQEFVDEYLADMESGGNRPGTIDVARRCLATFTSKVKPKWVARIDERTLEQFRTKRLRDETPQGKISPETVKKELRHLRAALAVANRWKYLREVPTLPKVLSDQREKPHVLEPHFLAMLKAADAAEAPELGRHDLAEGTTPGDWWQALFVTLFVTGARIGAVLRLRWEDVDWDTGRVLSRAVDLKQRKDTRPEIRGALPYLLKIRAGDPRLLPWNLSRRALYAHFDRIQEAAGIDLPCPKAGVRGHICRSSCHQYGFHAFRYAHARLNYANPGLQNQMGHACAATTEHYRKWGQREMAEYGAYLPPALSGGDDPRKNSGETAEKTTRKKNSGETAETTAEKMRFRVVGA